MIGSGLSAAATGMDEHAAKLLAASCGIATAPGKFIHSTRFGSIPHMKIAIVKPVSGGSRHGVSLAQNELELAVAIEIAARNDQRILIEDVVEAREIDVAVVREADGTTWTAQPLEIQTPGLFDPETRCNSSAPFAVPAELPPDKLKALTEAGVTVFDALGCQAVDRIYSFLTYVGPILNEVNTILGMTADSQGPRIFAAAGIP